MLSSVLKWQKYRSNSPFNVVEFLDLGLDTLFSGQKSESDETILLDPPDKELENLSGEETEEYLEQILDISNNNITHVQHAFVSSSSYDSPPSSQIPWLSTRVRTATVTVPLIRCLRHVCIRNLRSSAKQKHPGVQPSHHLLHHPIPRAIYATLTTGNQWPKKNMVTTWIIRQTRIGMSTQQNKGFRILKPQLMIKRTMWNTRSGQSFNTLGLMADVNAKRRRISANVLRRNVSHLVMVLWIAQY